MTSVPSSPSWLRLASCFGPGSKLASLGAGATQPGGRNPSPDPLLSPRSDPFATNPTIVASFGAGMPNAPGLGFVRRLRVARPCHPSPHTRHPIPPLQTRQSWLRSGMGPAGARGAHAWGPFSRFAASGCQRAEGAITSLIIIGRPALPIPKISVEVGALRRNFTTRDISGHEEADTKTIPILIPFVAVFVALLVSTWWGFRESIDGRFTSSRPSRTMNSESADPSEGVTDHDGRTLDPRSRHRHRRPPLVLAAQAPP